MTKPGIDFTLADVENTLSSRFEKIADTIPLQPAFKYQNQELNYSELNTRANEVAYDILSRDTSSKTVAILVNTPNHQMVAQLGILKAGKACVPIDHGFPTNRTAQILTDSKAQLVITDNEMESKVGEASDRNTDSVNIETLPTPIDRCSENPEQTIKPVDLAYVLYTSGTTGTPKGVMQNHRNLLRVAYLYHHDLGFSSQDRVTSPTMLTYTGTIWAVLASLMNGAAFICSEFDSPHAFEESLNQEKITKLQLITTLLRQFMLGSPDALSLPDLRLVYTGGETLHRADIREFLRSFPSRCDLLYNFGSTEAGIISHHPIQLDLFRENRKPDNKERSTLHVGKPVNGVRISIVDDSEMKIESGEAGEIEVNSEYLALGYWEDPELTARHFLSDASGDPITRYKTSDMGRLISDGTLVLSGRRDSQVKIRGYRINLEEIELALRSINGISGAAAVVHPDTNGKDRIMGYVEYANDISYSADQLRKELKTRLPDYMIPSLFQVMDQLPAANNGKLDRKALPDPGSERPNVFPDYIEPRTSHEKLVCELFSEVMQIDKIGIKDNFINLGGDSIVAFRFLGKLKRRTDIQLAPSQLFTEPTMESLAKILDEIAQSQT